MLLGSLKKSATSAEKYKAGRVVSAEGKFLRRAEICKKIKNFFEKD